jgi:HEAT repeat protein
VTREKRRGGAASPRVFRRLKPPVHRLKPPVLPVLGVIALLAACRGADLEAADPERRAAAVRAAQAKATDGDLSTLVLAQADPSPVVRRAAAESYAARGGAGAVEGLGKLLLDPAPEVAAAAAQGLSSLPPDEKAKEALLVAYGRAGPPARRAIADALEKLGVSLREAVELEARALWERNVAALDEKGPARPGAAEEVGASARADAVQRLLPLVDPAKNPDPALAAAAARALGEAGDWAARRHLEALLAEDDAQVVEAAAGALGRLGDPGAAAALARAAAEGPSRSTLAAVDALAELPAATEVGDALCALALRTSEPAVAARAARSAAAREADCPRRPFFAKLGRAGTEAALAALGELGLFGAEAQSAAVQVLPYLEPGRGDAASRTEATRFLGRTGSAAAAAAVQKRAEALSARLAAARARWIPGRLPDAPAAGFDAAPEARVEVVVARAPSPKPAPDGAPASPEWVDAVAVPEAAELAALLVAAGRLRAGGAEPLLVAHLRDPLPAVRAAAVEGLAQLGTPSALEAVLPALGDPSLRVRVAAADGLGRHGGRVVPQLAAAAAAATNAEPAWREALARALGDTGSAEAVPALAAFLEGPDAAAAAFALARLASPAGAAPLVAYLERDGARALAPAIDALAQLAAREASPAIAMHLTHDLPDVRAAAARALGRLRHEAASPRLEALRSDYYGRVRRAAIEALAKLPAGAPRARP